MHIHFGFTSGVALSAPRGVGYLTSAALIDMGIGMYRPLADLVYSGVFERFPALELVARSRPASVGSRTSATTSTTTSSVAGSAAGVRLGRMPSEYFTDHVWATFIEDPHGIRNRHEIGVDKIMWSTDYPHTNSNWPNSQRIAAYEFCAVPEAERRLIMHDNAPRLYGLENE